jgi:hypothetical protein
VITTLDFRSPPIATLRCFARSDGAAGVGASTAGGEDFGGDAGSSFRPRKNAQSAASVATVVPTTANTALIAPSWSLLAPRKVHNGGPHCSKVKEPATSKPTIKTSNNHRHMIDSQE